MVLYVAGYADHRPSRAHVADLLLAAREENQPSRLRDLVARALGDPGASVAWWATTTTASETTWTSRSRRPTPTCSSSSPGAGRSRWWCPTGLPSLEPSVLDSVAEALRLSTENRRLTEELEDSLEQVRESRARIQSASDETRKRIERDLHDGAQQLLISTGVKLNLASARAEEPRG